MYKKIIIGLIILSSFLVLTAVSSTEKPDAYSRATPRALKKKMSKNLSLKISGKVRKEYLFTRSDLEQYATIRLRTREVQHGGKLNGAYIYHGIPVFSIIEGIAPHKTSKDLFDRPLDLIVIFRSANGEERYFSYGELAICDDNDPVILAFYREGLRPTKNPESYKKNLDKGPISGLKLVCPGDFTTERFLDRVVSIEFRSIQVSVHLLPKTRKGMECSSRELYAVSGNQQRHFLLNNPITVMETHWFRIGHGRGIKGDRPASARGYQLADLIRKNFPDCSRNDFFLFVGCDGYRALVSGYELFASRKGRSFMLINSLDGKKLKKGFTLGLLSDYFVDRDVRELSHIEMIRL